MANNQNPNIPNQSSPDYHNETKQENLNSSNTSNSPSPDELLKELKVYLNVLILERKLWRIKNIIGKNYIEK